MKECEAGIVSQEIYFDDGAARNDEYIFEDSSGGLACDLR